MNNTMNLPTLDQLVEALETRGITINFVDRDGDFGVIGWDQFVLYWDETPILQVEENQECVTVDQVVNLVFG